MGASTSWLSFCNSPIGHCCVFFPIELMKISHPRGCRHCWPNHIYFVCFMATISSNLSLFNQNHSPIPAPHHVKATLSSSVRILKSNPGTHTITKMKSELKRQWHEEEVRDYKETVLNISCEYKRDKAEVVE